MTICPGGAAGEDSDTLGRYSVIVSEMNGAETVTEGTPPPHGIDPHGPDPQPLIS